MWSSDYAHSETSWPNSQKVVEAQFAGVPDEERDRIVRDNAAELFSIDIAKIRGGASASAAR